MRPAAGHNGTGIFEMRKVWLIVLMAFIPLGCTTLEDVKPPSIDLANLQMGSAGLLSQELKLRIKIGNPNDFAIPLSGLSFKLEVNGLPFAEGLSNESVTVPRLSYADTRVTGNTNTLTLLRQLMTLGNNDKIDYRLHGTAYVGRLGQNDAIPFERKGTLSLLPAPLGHGAGPGGFRSFAPSPR